MTAPTPAVTDWPVAEIPTPPTANHPAGVLIPLHWPHHGDLRILVDDLEVFAAADDLHALAEYDDSTPHPHPLFRPDVTWAKRDGAELLELYPLAHAVAVLEHAPTHQTRELLAWLREQLPLVLNEHVVDAAIGLESFLDAWTVQQAAKILDRDPQIAIGRTRLFAHLERIGWIHRDHDEHWAPRPDATRQGLLTLRDITIRSGTRGAEAYTQLYITEAGLAELRRTLYALHPVPPDPVEPEQLPIP